VHHKIGNTQKAAHLKRTNAETAFLFPLTLGKGIAVGGVGLHGCQTQPRHGFSDLLGSTAPFPFVCGKQPLILGKRQIHVAKARCANVDKTFGQGAAKAAEVGGGGC